MTPWETFVLSVAFGVLAVALIVGLMLALRYVGDRQCFPRHDFGPWEDVEGVRLSHAKENFTVREGIVQERRCKRCQCLQLRTEWKY